MTLSKAAAPHLLYDHAKVSFAEETPSSKLYLLADRFRVPKYIMKITSPVDPFFSQCTRTISSGSAFVTDDEQWPPLLLTCLATSLPTFASSKLLPHYSSNCQPIWMDRTRLYVLPVGATKFPTILAARQTLNPRHGRTTRSTLSVSSFSWRPRTKSPKLGP